MLKWDPHCHCSGGGWWVGGGDGKEELKDEMGGGWRPQQRAFVAMLRSLACILRIVEVCREVLSSSVMAMIRRVEMLL